MILTNVLFQALHWSLSQSWHTCNVTVITYFGLHKKRLLSAFCFESCHPSQEEFLQWANALSAPCTAGWAQPLAWHQPSLLVCAWVPAWGTHMELTVGSPCQQWAWMESPWPCLVSSRSSFSLNKLGEPCLSSMPGDGHPSENSVRETASAKCRTYPLGIGGGQCYRHIGLLGLQSGAGVIRITNFTPLLPSMSCSVSCTLKVPRSVYVSDT